jgi:hypothetical protein
VADGDVHRSPQHRLVILPSRLGVTCRHPQIDYSAVVVPEGSLGEAQELLRESGLVEM